MRDATVISGITAKKFVCEIGSMKSVKVYGNKSLFMNRKFPRHFPFSSDQSLGPILNLNLRAT